MSNQYSGNVLYAPYEILIIYKVQMANIICKEFYIYAERKKEQTFLHKEFNSLFVIYLDFPYEAKNK